MSKGLKRICMNCGTRFYDLDKNPIICPSCNTEFTGEIKVKGRRVKAAAEPAPAKEAKVTKEDTADDIEDINADDDIVSLDDVEDDDDDSENETLTIDSDPDDLEDDIDDLDDDVEDDDDSK